MNSEPRDLLAALQASLNRARQDRLASPAPEAAREVRASHHVHRGAESIPCWCAAAFDHLIGQEIAAPAPAVPADSEVCGVENPDYPGEYACTFPQGHGPVPVIDDGEQGGWADHGSPEQGAWWSLAGPLVPAPAPEAARCGCPDSRDCCGADADLTPITGGLAPADGEVCESCDGTGRTIQGWTDKNGYDEDQYGPCADCSPTPRRVLTKAEQSEHLAARMGKPNTPADGARDAGRLSEIRSRLAKARQVRVSLPGELHGGPEANYSPVFIENALAKHAPGDANDPELRTLWCADSEIMASAPADLDWLSARLDAVEAERDTHREVAEAMSTKWQEELARANRLEAMCDRLAGDRVDREDAAEARAEKAEAEVTSLRAELAERSGAERVEWGVQLQSGKTLPTWDGGYSTRREAEREAMTWAGTTKVIHRTRRSTPDVVSPWVAVEAGDDGE